MKDTEPTLRPMTQADVADVLSLSDRCVGKGLYSAEKLRALLRRTASVCLVLRTADGVLAGYCLTYLADIAEAAALTKLPPAALRALSPAREPRVGICKSLGTEAAFRGKGLGCRLQNTCADALFALGADFLLGVAWRKGYHIPVRGILERLGFCYLRDSEHVWYDEPGLACPYCGETRCVCPAAIFVRKRGEGA
ncbi:hypothetical protein NE562_15160 [Butyricicoccus faecihominis]|uniref:GNAT family N-acetyltransferase n=1 Tax=Butyricicoccus faecihominis TaxID=1712515 RepID=UPI0024794A0F|nr:GNAT family N-acetyltransferase [Butyricicoccus faecihominis]MCQ5131003.1 hypothetical protein [Butyricicoccus faecihominis]